ncbi:hypothetical protein GGR52DRAFT_487270 [Hypoxylon sp. FL1284]|nr:hypothetical protein GGR52DRAFT_487270 [Hypoxylon sp. FL1284]
MGSQASAYVCRACWVWFYAWRAAGVDLSISTVRSTPTQAGQVGRPAGRLAGRQASNQASKCVCRQASRQGHQACGRAGRQADEKGAGDKTPRRRSATGVGHYSIRARIRKRTFAGSNGYIRLQPS